jgi:hypothetical protein
LRRGGYRQLHVAHEQLAFARGPVEGSEGAAPGDARGVIVAVNAAAEAARVEIPLSAVPDAGRAAAWRDLLNPPESLQAHGGRLVVEVPPRWARVLSP